jgi:integrin beta 2
MNLNSGTYVELVNNGLSIVPVDYNLKEGMAYFGDYQSHQISKVPINNSGVAVTILRRYHGASEPDGLAIDWINDWIYWSSPHYRTISMAKLDGSYERVIVNEGQKLDEPRGVAVDPFKGYLFWADWGNHSHIGRAAMDGSHQEYIVEDNVVWPNGIAVDTITRQVYWVDGYLGTVGYK